MAETEEAVEQQQSNEQQEAGQQSGSEQVAQKAEFSEAGESASGGPGGSVEMLLDMTLPVTVSLGRTKMPVRRLLQLTPGSVVQLDKEIEAPVDLYVRDTKFATGDVVVVDGQFAVRVKEVCGVCEAAGDADEGGDG